MIPASLKVLTKDSGQNPQSVEVLTFEPGREINRLDAGAFGEFDSLKSICIAASVEVLGGNCFVEAHSPTRGSVRKSWPLATLSCKAGSKLCEIEPGLLAALRSLQLFWFPRQLRGWGGTAFVLASAELKLKVEIDISR
jgi:hypothetical protein